MYTDVSPEQHCQYPCSTSNSVTELHHFLLCPSWSCSMKTTTTSASPPLSTLSPWPTSLSNYSTTICVASLVLNALFGIIIFALVGLFLISAYLNSSTNPLFDAGFDLFENEHQRPIIRNSERAPLLLPPRASNSRQDDSGARGSSQTFFLSQSKKLNFESDEMITNG